VRNHDIDNAVGVSVSEAAETRYVAVGDADVAYQVLGSGARDLVYCFGLFSHIEAWRELSGASEFLGRLASFSRLIFFDRRGTGASDGLGGLTTSTWEEWAQDLGAVLDAAGSQRTAIVASADAGPFAILYTASHNERVSALVLHNTSARFLAADDYPIGASTETADAFIELIRTQWGTPDLAGALNPSIADDADMTALFAKATRMALTPRSAARQMSYILHSLDVRAFLPLIRVPTLVLSMRENPILPIDHGHYLAEHIPDARFVEIPGGDFGFFTSSNFQVTDEVAQLLTGKRPAIEIDRVLSTVLFTDIVASTEQVASRGDEAWRRVLDEHDSTTCRIVAEYRGRVVKQLGDGTLATFDGPARAVRCAAALVDAAKRQGITLRAGLHTGEIELRPADVAGIAVHIASRIAALASPTEILVSRTVVDLTAGSGLGFEPRAEHELKGVPGIWPTFAAVLHA
jgi:class 3 adenylate cyclase/pimeloyl-ACP methyl ester carboxylesterase